VVDPDKYCNSLYRAYCRINIVTNGNRIIEDSRPGYLLTDQELPLFFLSFLFLASEAKIPRIHNTENIRNPVLIAAIRPG